MGGRWRGNIISKSYTGLSINFYSVMVEGSPFITLQGLNLEPELKPCWCLMPLGHRRESLLVSRVSERKVSLLGGKKRKIGEKKKRFCLSDRAVQLSANAKEGKTLRRHVKPLIQLSVVLVGSKWRLACERDPHSACVVQPFPPSTQPPQPEPRAQGMCYADFPISMIDLILDDSVPKCLCEIISLATEQLLNTRNC